MANSLHVIKWVVLSTAVRDKRAARVLLTINYAHKVLGMYRFARNYFGWFLFNVYAVCGKP